MMDQSVANSLPAKKGCYKGCVVIFGMLLCLVGGGVWLIMDPNSPLNKASAIACVCEWARLNPLPVPNSAVHVETKGSMFTREFIVTFHGSKNDILQWLNASPGTQNAYRDAHALKYERMDISPGGGAQFAEITISEDGTKVVIRAYWS